MKFINLLKKELSELINKQMIFSLIFTVAIFFIMGKVMESATSEIVEEAKSLVPNVYMRKGSTLLKEKNFAGAAAALSEVTKLTPEDGMAFLLLGQAQMQAGSPEAIASLEKANELGETQAVKLLSTSPSEGRQECRRHRRPGEVQQLRRERQRIHAHGQRLHQERQEQQRH